MITLKDGTQFTPIEIPDNYKQVAKQLNTPEMQSYLANQTRKQLYDNLSNNIVKDIPYRNHNEGVEQLLEENNSKQDEQIEILMHLNSELQTKLDKSNFELKQLNDKISSQNLYIKGLKADLKEETERRIKVENKLSSKDWKLALISFAVGVGSGLVVAWITWLVSN